MQTGKQAKQTFITALDDYIAGCGSDFSTLFRRGGGETGKRRAQAVRERLDKLPNDKLTLWDVFNVIVLEIRWGRASSRVLFRALETVLGGGKLFLTTIATDFSGEGATSDMLDTDDFSKGCMWRMWREAVADAHTAHSSDTGARDGYFTGLGEQLTKAANEAHSGVHDGPTMI